MHVDEVVSILDQPAAAASFLESLGIESHERGLLNLQSIAKSGMSLDQVGSLFEQFQALVQEISDTDLALKNLERFVLAARNPLAMGSLFQRDTTALPILLRIFSASQHLSDLLIRDTESYDSLRLTEGQLYSREQLTAELKADISNATETMQAMQILRRFKHRETLRIAFGDLIVGHRLTHITEQISHLADSIIEAARHFTHQQLVMSWGEPQQEDGTPCRLVILALGKLGGVELNYSSDIDLIVVFDSDGKTSKNGKPARQFFERVTRETIKLLNETTSLGAAYRVDMRLRPEGSRGPICCTEKSFLRYYDLQGRTWERQALIKARPVAGDLEFGDRLLDRLQPWIYRPLLNRFDIADIRALKRQIEQRSVAAGEESTNVKTGHGGIRDIEFTSQFLQLLNGGVVREVRTGNTLEAIRLLDQHDCLQSQEAELLSQNYVWLRKLEHLLQIMFDLQTHRLPEDDRELSKVAKRMGYREFFGVSARRRFENDLQEKTSVNNRILNHLLHDAFAENDSAENSNEPSAVDLVLHSEIEHEQVQTILSAYHFADIDNAARLIGSLSTENTLFLSSNRCRHFLAAIIQDLLQQIANTPDPDSTLVSLSTVADAIGGKGALWELFSFNPPTLDLFVRLCASSDYLCTIVRRNPGMIDELVDSLLMNRLPSIEWLRISLDDLATGAVEVEPILHAFKNTQHLRIGIRDIVGKDAVRETHAALSDVAEDCIEKVAQTEFEKCAARHSNHALQPDEIQDRNGLVILALGKLGGREPNYHSDLDVVFLYDSIESNNVWLSTSPQHFYSELAARISKVVSATGPNGKLFEIDSRLRPTGKSGSLAVSFNEFQRYFASGQGQLWERQSLCKSRLVFGSATLRKRVMQLVHEIAVTPPWSNEMAEQIRSMRFKMQENCQPANLKRGIGGTVDVEFIVQMLQLRNAHHQQVLMPGTIQAIDALREIDAIKKETALYLIESYQFLRGVESRLRLMNTTARHDIPTGAELEKLAYLLRMQPSDLENSVADYRKRNREVFEQLFVATN